ncbi:MAG: 4a-hydroxytetrahydrobiopterin dehydratase [Candidatus Kapabacteria bacterium]|nr:4a-hydroxytetrahydrobiopterin dehydratase [Candidatus Kapabacteria bacterium]MDW8011683.1 4a-hydroxytetrahydrobiopterin dehydratase [Bacteroidota bacterium]
MARPPLLAEEELQQALQELPLWQREGNTLVREFVAPNFAAAVGLLNAIAVLAEGMDHHPDLLLYGWNKLRVTLTTHDRGGLTELDIRLAKAIEQLRFF